MLLSKTDLDSIVNVTCSQPHGILGMHPRKQGKKSVLVVRAYVDDAKTCEVVDVNDPDQRFTLNRLTEDGFFEGEITTRSEVFDYRLRIERYNGEFRQFYDPYRFLPTLSENDVYLFSEGTDHMVHHKMGGPLTHD